MLEVSGLRAGYGAINVLWDVSLEFAAGRVTTIIGPNGAGKTTLLRAIMGILPAAQGDIRFEGQTLSGLTTWDRVERGLAMVPEGRMVFRDMGVEENLVMGAFPKAHRAALSRNLERSYALFPRLLERRSQLAGSLSGGEAQMLALARGLMSEPRLILVDEPSLGLAPVVVREIFATLAALRKEGRTIVLVEQNTHLAVRAADHVYLLQGGKVQLSQPAAQTDLHQLHELYFGG
jgi:branched-chain amino acid transport system ATP-binding protein